MLFVLKTVERLFPACDPSLLGGPSIAWEWNAPDFYARGYESTGWVPPGTQWHKSQ